MGKDDLYSALDLFQEKINANVRLRKMLADWDRLIAVQADDLPDTRAHIVMRGGEMRWQEGEGESPDIVLGSSAKVLVGIFRGEITPTEPYLDGSLVVRGSQEDVIKLDFLSLMIWGE